MLELQGNRLGYLPQDWRGNEQVQAVRQYWQVYRLQRERKVAAKALHLTAIPLRSIAAGELGR